MLVLSNFWRRQPSPLVGSLVERLEKQQRLFLIWAWSLLRSYRGGSRKTGARPGSQEHTSQNLMDLTLLWLYLPSCHCHLTSLSLVAFRYQPSTGPSRRPTPCPHWEEP